MTDASPTINELSQSMGRRLAALEKARSIISVDPKRLSQKIEMRLGQINTFLEEHHAHIDTERAEEIERLTKERFDQRWFPLFRHSREKARAWAIKQSRWVKTSSEGALSNLRCKHAELTSLKKLADAAISVGATKMHLSEDHIAALAAVDGE